MVLLQAGNREGSGKHRVSPIHYLDVVFVSLFSRRMRRAGEYRAARCTRVRKLLTISLVPFFHADVVAVVVDFFRSRQIREVVMSIFSYRKHLRFLTPLQRRRWWDQKKRLTPRVRISGAYVPPSVSREFTYVKVG
ncbi:hypothetical protein [Paraburkholderia sp.]|uniref:hypothetical protein n=1 Tax=Paraburkholderia sp. TaxID=1926495 RepID=UPI003D6F04BC